MAVNRIGHLSINFDTELPITDKDVQVQIGLAWKPSSRLDLNRAQRESFSVSLTSGSVNYDRVMKLITLAKNKIIQDFTAKGHTTEEGKLD